MTAVDPRGRNAGRQLTRRAPRPVGGHSADTGHGTRSAAEPAHRHRRGERSNRAATADREMRPTRTSTPSPVTDASSKRISRRAKAVPTASAPKPVKSAVKPVKPVKSATLEQSAGSDRVRTKKLRQRRSRIDPERMPSVWKAGRPRRRLLAVFIVLMIALGIVLARVAFVQTVGSKVYLQAAVDQRFREVDLPADRGVIFAVGGEPLAMSVPASTIWANPSAITDPSGTAAALAAVLALNDSQRVLLQRSLSSDKQFVYVRRTVDEATATVIRELKLPGIGWYTEPRRVSPSGDVARSIVGTTSVDGDGVSGLEMKFDELLRPTQGKGAKEIAGRNRAIPGSQTIKQQPIPGDDLILTISRPLQFSAEEALVRKVEELQAKGATAIIMRTNGDILASASVRRSPETGEVLVSSANLAITDAFEPGSVSKVITMAAALNEGTITPETVFANVPMQKKYGDYTITDATRHKPDMTALEIMALSSNNGTVRVSETLAGPDVQEKYLRLFGFGAKTDLDLPGESGGILDSSSEWQGTDRVAIAYGYKAAATAMQLAAAVNAVANDGIYAAPRLIDSTIDENGTQQPLPPSATHPVIKPTAAADLTRMMVAVVCKGTARNAAPIPGISVAGKTGTAFKAQKNGYKDENGQYHFRATFAGFFPAEDPKITILVSIDEPDRDGARHGGDAAAPVFNEIAQTTIRELGIVSPVPNGGCEK